MTNTTHSGPVRLSVNVDHVATLREARRTSYPDPVEAAAEAEAAGASGITVHLRGDRRHIQDADVERLARAVSGKLNLEMAASDEMVAFALALEPHQCTLVPERPEEVTTEGGLDLATQTPRLLGACERLRDAGIEVSLFVDPDPKGMPRLEPFAGGLVAGFELNTDAYSRAAGGFASSQSDRSGFAGARRAELARSAAMGAALGLKVYAGHGLTAANVGPIAAIARMEELNIGHSLVSRAVLLGLRGAVEEMLAAIAAGSAKNVGADPD